MRRLEGPAFEPYRIPLAAMITDMKATIASGKASPEAHAKYTQFIEKNPLSRVRDDEYNGIFELKTPEGVEIHVMASSGGGWDHVSVSMRHRCPTWEEMSWVKRYFFKDSETAMQLHVATHAHISNHDFTLHLWRSHKQKIPLPPGSYV